MIETGFIFLVFSIQICLILVLLGATVTERKMYVNGSVRFLAASSRRRNDKWTLAVCSVTGLLSFLNSYDEVCFHKKLFLS